MTFPRLASSCSFHTFDNGGGREEYVLATGDGRQFKVSGLAYRILSRLDGQTSIDQIVAELNQQSVPISAEQLRQLLEDQYGSLGVIQYGSAVEPPAQGTRTLRRPGFPMLLAWDLVPEGLVGAVVSRLHFLFSPRALPLALFAIVASHLAVYSRPLETARLNGESYLWIILLCLLSILVHEFGHAAAVARFGGKPGAIGCGLYLLLPTFYADVSQLWRFPRKQRMVVDLGGVYFQQLVFVVFAVLAGPAGSPELLAACHLIDLMALMALNPLFHFDGYWFLADYLAIPKLQKTAFQVMGSWLRRLVGRPPRWPQLPDWNRPARWVFYSYSMLASLFLVATFWLVYRYLSNTLVQFPIVAPQALQATVAAFDDGDVTQFVVKVITLFFLLAFPATAVIGFALLLLRIARGTASWLKLGQARNSASTSLGG